MFKSGRILATEGHHLRITLLITLPLDRSHSCTQHLAKSLVLFSPMSILCIILWQGTHRFMKSFHLYIVYTICCSLLSYLCRFDDMDFISKISLKECGQTKGKKRHYSCWDKRIAIVSVWPEMFVFYKLSIRGTAGPKYHCICSVFMEVSVLIEIIKDKVLTSVGDLLLLL